MFEYDTAKSEANRLKHGIDFEQAKDLWDDPDVVTLPTHDLREPRDLVIGMIGDKHWTAIVTNRDGNIRIISVRRSREIERNHYERYQSL